MIYKVLLALLDKYGLHIAQLGLILFLAWKFHANHLHSLMEKLKENSGKLDKLDKTVGNLSERIAKIEGKIEK